MNAFAEAVKTKPNKPNQTHLHPKFTPKNTNFSIILDNSSPKPLRAGSTPGGVIKGGLLYY